MTRIDQLRPAFVHYIPEQPEAGVLYISERYATAMHLCCCGCGSEVVTPLNPAKWRLKVDGGTVSLHPSIGNWSFPCQSHYWLVRNRVEWAKAMTPAMIAAVKARDMRDTVALSSKPETTSTALGARLVAAFRQMQTKIMNWLKG